MFRVFVNNPYRSNSAICSVHPPTIIFIQLSKQLAICAFTVTSHSTKIIPLRIAPMHDKEMVVNSKGRKYNKQGM